MDAAEHVPVLYQQVLDALTPERGGCYIDGTVGAGGHAAGILERSAPQGRLLGLDLDPEALQVARRRLAPFAGRFTLVQGDFAELGRWAREYGCLTTRGVLLDLGCSSLQLSRPERGFSCQLDGPLDMRFDPSQEVTAADLVNTLPEGELADLLYRYGEEPAARRIARQIVQARRREPIRRTGQLARLVRRAVGRRRTRIDPATRTFMALRIAVNRELERLRQGLAQAVEVLAPGGRLVVISFHSLEDRLVKTFIRQEQGECDWPSDLPVHGCPHFSQEGAPCRAWSGGRCARPLRLRALGQAIRPEAEEVARNPRARSARLRVAERL